MLKFDFSNLYAETVSPAHGLTRSEIEDMANLAKRGHDTFQKWRKSEDAAFYDVVFSDQPIVEMKAKAHEVATKFKNVVVLGIGGSALGLRCASQSLLGPYWNVMDERSRGNLPKLFVCDNVDPETFSSLLKVAKPTETCYIVISKSGKTTETAAQFFVAMDVLKKEVGAKWKDHLIIITDPIAGELRPFATAENITTFPIPQKLGGRFSVLCPVGLFPAACAGMDIEAMLDGARDMAKACSTSDIEKNPAYFIGSSHFFLDTQKQKHMSVMMPYADSLFLTSEWYAQLWAESLGKNGKGQTPVKALGATDQHSQVQLYMEGPNDKVFTFIGVEHFGGTKETTISNTMGSFGYIENKNMGDILRAEQIATTRALSTRERPNLTITFPKADAYHLGQFFMLYEIATALAGALYDINPFDQPGVELGKKLTKEILSK